jgi:hypothetical protein
MIDRGFCGGGRLVDTKCGYVFALHLKTPG